MIEDFEHNSNVPYEKLFPGQLPEEHVRVLVREHWFRLFIKYFIVFVLSLLPWLIKTLLLGGTYLVKSVTAAAIVNTLIGTYYIGLLVGAFIIYVIYYLNVYVVSEDRIVDIDQSGLLLRQVSELNIETVEDVTSQKVGFFGNIFSYGTVFVQTAGATERFEFTNIPDPDRISSIILELFEQHEGRPLKPKITKQ